MPVFMMILLMFVSILLILVILLQRGRGGGLVGALSGLGGQSAFGTKAGDTFTRITIGIAAVWVLLAGISGWVLRSHTVKFKGNAPPEIGSLTKDAGAGVTDNANETGAKGTDSNKTTESDGDSAAEKSSKEADPDAAANTSSNAKSGKSAGASKSPAKNESEADPSAPVKDPDSAEKPGDPK